LTKSLSVTGRQDKSGDHSFHKISDTIVIIIDGVFPYPHQEALWQILEKRIADRDIFGIIIHYEKDTVPVNGTIFADENNFVMAFCEKRVFIL